MKLARYIQITPTDESAEGTKFFRMYFSALPLGGGLSVTELHPADDLALLAANCFVQSWTDQGKSALISRRPCTVVAYNYWQEARVPYIKQCSY